VWRLVWRWGVVYKYVPPIVAPMQEAGHKLSN
jgi:hypothetical protein